MSKLGKFFKEGWKLKIILFFSFTVFLVVVASIGYFQGLSDAKQTIKKEIPASKKSEQLSLANQLQNVLEKEQKKIHVVNDEPIVFKETTPKKKVVKKEVLKKQVNSSYPVKNKIIKDITGRAKLAIIMDDVSFTRDVRAIKALNIPITMSFLPPTKIHPKSAILANKELVYMVHLPLEAMVFNAEESTTLRVGDSYEKISKRIKDIKKLFPRAYYINNHTGSKFTSDLTSMRYLFKALHQVNIGFLDSRTTAKTKAPQVSRERGLPYIARDMFLDHEADVNYIKNQIRKAVKKAKKKGYAIVICHPRKDTLIALKRSLSLLKEVELVYVNKLI